MIALIVASILVGIAMSMAKEKAEKKRQDMFAKAFEDINK